MNKQELLKKYSEEEKILISKILDKIKYTKEKNRVEHSDFLNMHEQKIVHNFLKKVKEENYIFYGGFEQAERKILILYPEKLAEVFKESIPNIDKVIKVIRINLPNENKGKYLHKNYLSGLMKLGIKREKVGDIIVDKLGADIIIEKDLLKYLLQELYELKRFSKSEIFEISLNELKLQKIEKEEMKIIVSSPRLDSVVSELARISRNKASEIILAEKVFLNYACETKMAREIKVGDIVTIRGKGRFTVKDFLGKSKKEKNIILVEKFKN